MNPLWAGIGILPFACAPWIQRSFIFEWREPGKPLWRLPPRGQIALTFDDGPESDNTPRLLDMLDRYSIAATFFVVGTRAKESPDLIRRIVDSGHAIGSHGMTHTPLAFRSYRAYITEVRDAVRDLEDMTGKSVFLFRPPYGIRSPELYSILRKEGLRPVFWDVMAFDWMKPSAKWISQRVLRSIREGSIVLLHDGGGARSRTIDAIPFIEQGVRTRGLEFTRLNDFA